MRQIFDMLKENAIVGFCAISMVALGYVYVDREAEQQIVRNECKNDILYWQKVADKKDSIIYKQMEKIGELKQIENDKD